MWKMAIHLSET